MKSKVLIGLSALLFAVCCGPKLDTETAGGIIKTTFNLTDKDSVEVLGIAKETNDLMLVKVKINGAETNTRIRKYDKGWQLDEIQDLMAGWVSVEAVRGRFDPTKKMEKIRADLLLIGNVLTSYSIDHNFKFPKEDVGILATNSNVYRELCPKYATSLPGTDPWGGPYFIAFNQSIDGSFYGVKGGDYDFLICSWGRDRKQESWLYDANNDRAGLYKGYDPNKDIVYLSGTFIRAPEDWQKKIVK